MRSNTTMTIQVLGADDVVSEMTFSLFLAPASEPPTEVDAADVEMYVLPTGSSSVAPGLVQRLPVASATVDI
jgi:hypothetical protein